MADGGTLVDFGGAPMWYAYRDGRPADTLPGGGLAREAAWDALRVIPPAILTGQAAGTAAAHAIREEKPITGIDLPALQADMEKQNVAVHFDDADVHKELSGKKEGNDD